MSRDLEIFNSKEEPEDDYILKFEGLIQINEAQSYNYDFIADEDGEYHDWIEIYNISNQTINLSQYYLSDSKKDLFKWQFPETYLYPQEYLLVFASLKDRKDPMANLHSNFKIDSDGEKIYLTKSNKITVDMAELPELYNNLSYIRINSTTWEISDNPTPGFSNQESIAPPTFSLNQGFYPGIQSVELFSENEIYYTTDGKNPTKLDGQLYSVSININDTTVLAARCYQDSLASKVVRKTYIINSNTDLAVFSISTDPKNFFDTYEGIYVTGLDASPDMPHYGANYWEDWEKPIHIEYFDENDNYCFEMDAGVKIFGAYSRTYEMKSLSIFARKRYGYPEINYNFFDKKNSEEQTITSFKSLVLRNSGNDFYSTIMRDAMMTSLLEGIDIDRQAYKPVVVFINGAYWGIHNLREKINEDYLAANYAGVYPDNIDLLEYSHEIMEALEGDTIHYEAMLDYIDTNGLASTEHYEYIQTQMDVDNFIDYQIANIYFDNKDWPGNNNKYWRPKTTNGRWRWIVYDTDFGFGLLNENAYNFDTLAFALEPNGPSWPNPPASTFLLRKFFENDAFKTKFLARFDELLNTNFDPNTVVAKIDSMKAVIENEINNHGTQWSTMWDWDTQVQKLRNFANNRKAVLEVILDNFSKTNLASGKSVTVSSVQDENEDLLGENAVDGDTDTRWSSDFNDPEWIYVDLGSSQFITRVVLRWENAYGKEYKIQVSENATDWTDILHKENGDGGTDDLTVSGTGRYVRMYGIQREEAWGYSLWEFEIYE
ncbi:MAG: CotH kinase family protein [Spirochaetes bacterium]|nr:CotH kinase family protein [Spirochaetota bacterium]